MKPFIRRNIATTNSLLKNSASLHLDFIRGFASILVLFNHFRNIFFVPYSDVNNQSTLNLLAYSFTGLGHQAVMIFFVLSGFFIANSVIKQVVKNSWSWKDYLISRLTRLYIVLIPALILGFIIDSVGIYFFDYSFFPHDMNERISLEVLVGNLFYLQGFATTSFGTNDPLWSLSYEFWYYLLFPSILLILISNIKKFYKIAYLTFVIGCFFFVGKTVSLYFTIWLMGFAVLLLPTVNIKSVLVKYVLKLIAGILFIISLAISRLGLISIAFLGDLFVSVTFSILVYSIIHLKTNTIILPKVREVYFKVSESIANFSFTLYLIHFPILIFLFALMNKFGFNKMQPTLINILYGIIICVFVMLVAYVISLFTERKTNQLRNFVFKNTNRNFFFKKLVKY